MAIDIESALLAFLAGNSSVTSLLGTASADSIYPMRIAKDAQLPSLVYHRVSGLSEHTKDGDAGLTRARFQLTAWAAKYGDAIAVIKAVRVALTTYAGPTLEGQAVPEVVVENEQDLSDSETLEYGRSLDVIVWVQE